MKRIFLTIYILLLGTLISVPFSIDPVLNLLFEAEVARVEREYARGTFSLLEERLLAVGPEGRAAVLDSLRPRFGYPLGLLELSRAEIDDRDRTDFLNGLIVGSFDDGTLFMRLGQSDQVLSMGGPWPDKDLNIKVTILALIFLVLFLTLPALAWTFFLIRDIRKIEAAAGRFTSGDHDARVRVSRISSMTQIANALNALAEKTQKLIASQKDLSNSVSHEIRTPLARIKFSLEMAKDSPGHTDYMDEIGQDVEEIESLVDEMLTYARFEREPENSGRLSHHEMVSWLDNLVRQEQKTAQGKTVEFSSDSEQFIARFEPVYLGWAVRNILRNAVRHSTGRVRLEFAPDRSCARIRVDDDGAGVPEAHREKIFEPFSARTAAGPGHPGDTAWAWPSPAGSSPGTGERSGSPPRPGAVRGLPWSCPGNCRPETLNHHSIRIASAGRAAVRPGGNPVRVLPNGVPDV